MEGKGQSKDWPFLHPVMVSRSTDGGVSSRMRNSRRPASIDRREMLRRTGVIGAAIALGCDSKSDRGTDGRLSVRPFPPTTGLAPGLHELVVGTSRGGVIFVPNGYDHAVPAPLILLLHGATGSGEGIASGFLDLADELDVVLCAPDARGLTWDATRDEFGPDVRFIDGALERVFASVNVDPARIAIAGFSDGATYALSLGLINGDLFSRIVAFSPGFIVTGDRRGQPGIFVSHGVQDQVLPIDRCSRVIVPFLEQLGYAVDYREFDGGHVVPLTLARDAFTGVVAGAAPAEPPPAVR